MLTRVVLLSEILSHRVVHAVSIGPMNGSATSLRPAIYGSEAGITKSPNCGDLECIIQEVGGFVNSLDFSNYYNTAL